MLAIILRVLMITGIVLLVLLAVFLATVCLVLFVPITYKVFGTKNGEGIQLQVKADWMLGLIRLRFAYPKPGNVTVKGLCFSLYDSSKPSGKRTKESGKTSEKPKDNTSADMQGEAVGKKDGKSVVEAASEFTTEENPEAASKAEAEAKSEAVFNAKSRAESDSESKSKAEAESDSEVKSKVEADSDSEVKSKAETESDSEAKSKAKSALEAKSKTEEASDIESETEAESDSASEKKGFAAYFLEKLSKIKKIRYTITDLYAKIKGILHNIMFYRDLFQDEQTQALLRHGMFRLGRILKSIRPRKIRGNILFGTGEPDTTGYAFGIYGMISAWLGNDICVTPDFTQAILEGELYAAGHITLLRLLWHGLRVILDRRLRLLFHRIKTHKL